VKIDRALFEADSYDISVEFSASGEKLARENPFGHVRERYSPRRAGALL
jgi:hypothetical protein